jgi:hypothetical protein
MSKLFLSALFACAAAIGTAQAQVVVRVAPPRAVVERPGPRPGPQFVWIPGYHRWDSRAYVWVPGRWEAPPRRHAHWVPARWVHRHNGWVLIEGHWR